MSLKNLKSWVDGERELFDIDRLSCTSEKPRREGRGQPGKICRFPVKAVSVLTALVLLAVLLAMVYALPLFGSGTTTDNELSQRYVEHGMHEVGAQNLVANIILVYRGFDTFGEATVLFTAASCVIFLLSGFETGIEPAGSGKNSTILRTVVLYIFPFVLVFGVYILLNGHLSPGGGFSGGAVLGAGLILLDVALGQPTLNRFFDHKVYTVIKVGALLIYGSVIIYLVFCGANGLANGIPLGSPGRILSAGVILPINLMVGFEVACTMYAFYTYFYRGELK